MCPWVRNLMKILNLKLKCPTYVRSPPPVPLPLRLNIDIGALRPVQTDQTCWSNIIQHCWVLLDGVRVWSVLDCVGCWSVHTNPTPSNNVGFRYHARNYGVLLIMRAKMLDDVGWKVWTSQTSSNIFQHYPTCLIVLFKRVQHDMLRPTMFDNVWPTWSVWTGL